MCVLCAILHLIRLLERLIFICRHFIILCFSFSFTNFFITIIIIQHSFHRMQLFLLCQHVQIHALHEIQHHLTLKSKHYRKTDMCSIWPL